MSQQERSRGAVLARATRDVARWVRHAPVRRDWLAEWHRRIRRRPPPLPKEPILRVLTVCHGNIARSPFSEALLAARSPQLSVRSGGLEAVAGRPGDEAAVRMAKRFGVDMASHRAHRIEAEDVAWADLILVMQGRHLSELTRRWPRARAKARLLGHFLMEPPFGIADPWDCGDEVFALTFQRIGSAVDGLAALLEETPA